MDLAGSLGDVSLTDVLQVLCVTAQTGVLTVTAPERRGELTFVAGRVVIAQLTPPKEHIASYFVKRGWIDFETLHEALKRQAAAEPRPLIGQLLLELGALTREQLVAGLGQHVRHVVSELVAFRRGTFAFAPGPQGAAGESADVGLDGEELQRLAKGEHDRQPDPLDDGSWQAKPRTAVIITDDLLVRHGLELRLRSEAFALVSAPTIEDVAGLLLASEDPEPTLIVDLDPFAAARARGLHAFRELKRLLRQWPSVKLLTYGRQVPDSYYAFLLRTRVFFHLPRTSRNAEDDIRVIQDFIEALAQLVTRDASELDGPESSI